MWFSSEVWCWIYLAEVTGHETRLFVVLQLFYNLENLNILARRQQQSEFEIYSSLSSLKILEKFAGRDFTGSGREVLIILTNIPSVELSPSCLSATLFLRTNKRTNLILKFNHEIGNICCSEQSVACPVLVFSSQFNCFIKGFKCANKKFT